MEKNNYKKLYISEDKESCNLPGAIASRFSCFNFIVDYGSFGFWVQPVGISTVLSYSNIFSKIKEDYENDLFSIGNDAIIGVYDLYGVPDDEISRVKSDILLQESERLRSFNNNHFYDENVIIEIIEQVFPMSYSEQDLTSFLLSLSTHVVVIKDYKKCLGIECEEIEVVGADSQMGTITSAGRAKTLGLWLRKILNGKNNSQ
ncbi:MAG TPA: hypothetical protein PLC53_01055 [Bacilli bacterium]|nr:hypothetical protein [Bacilli bacterium]